MSRITDHLSDLAARQVSRRTALKVMGGTTAATMLTALAPRVAGAQQTAMLQGGPPAQPTGTLRIANPGEPNWLDPAMALEHYEFSPLRSVYEGLIGWNEDYSVLVPELATEWSPNADASEWTFKLREGVTFHDGSPFDSAAVKASFEHYDPNTTNWGFLMSGLESIETPDASTVVLKFSAPSPDIARNQVFIKMMSPGLLARSEAGGDPSAQPINQEATGGGTGPYLWQERVPGQSITLVANPSYWDTEHPPHFESVVYNSISDTDAALTALQAGNVDLAPRLSPLHLQRAQGDQNLATSIVDSWLEIHLIMRNDQAPLDNVKVRQAIAYALDRQAIIDDVLLGQAQIATSLMPPGTYGRAEPTTTYSYDTDKAKALLAEAGYDGKEIKIVSGPNAPFPLVAQAIAAQLQEAGINASAESMDAGVAVTDVIGADNPVHLILLSTYGWVNGGPFHYNVRTVVNHPRTKDPDVLASVDAVNTTPDGDERLKVLADAQELYAQRVPDFPLYYPKVLDAFTKKLQGYKGAVDAYQYNITDAYFSE